VQYFINLLVLLTLIISVKSAKSQSPQVQDSTVGQVVIGLAMHKDSKLSSACVRIENVDTWASYIICHGVKGFFGLSKSSPGIEFEDADNEGSIQKRDLPVGSYRIYSFSVYSARAATTFSPRMQLQGFFQIQSNQAIYLGHWLAHATSNRTAWYGASLAEGAFMVVSDKYETDKARLFKQDKALADSLKNNSFTSEQLRNPLVFSSVEEAKPNKVVADKSTEERLLEWINPKRLSDPALIKQQIAENMARLAADTFGQLPLASEKMGELTYHSDTSQIDPRLVRHVADFVGQAKPVSPVELLTDWTHNYVYQSGGQSRDSSFQRNYTQFFHKQEQGFTWRISNNFYKEKIEPIRNNESKGTKEVLVAGLFPFRGQNIKGKLFSAMVEFAAQGTLHSPKFRVDYTTYVETLPYDSKTKTLLAAQHHVVRNRQDCRWLDLANKPEAIRAFEPVKYLSCKHYLASDAEPETNYVLMEEIVFAWLENHGVFVNVRSRGFLKDAGVVSNAKTIEVFDR
jgi:hypothetical protein